MSEFLEFVEYGSTTPLLAQES